MSSKKTAFIPVEMNLEQLCERWGFEDKAFKHEIAHAVEGYDLKVWIKPYAPVLITDRQWYEVFPDVNKLMSESDLAELGEIQNNPSKSDAELKRVYLTNLRPDGLPRSFTVSQVLCNGVSGLPLVSDVSDDLTTRFFKPRKFFTPFNEIYLTRDELIRIEKLLGFARLEELSDACEDDGFNKLNEQNDSFLVVGVGSVYPFSSPPSPNKQDTLYRLMDVCFSDYLSKYGAVLKSNAYKILVDAITSGFDSMRIKHDDRSYFKSCFTINSKGMICEYDVVKDKEVIRKRVINYSKRKVEDT